MYSHLERVERGFDWNHFLLLTESDSIELFEDQQLNDFFIALVYATYAAT